MVVLCLLAGADRTAGLDSGDCSAAGCLGGGLVGLDGAVGCWSCRLGDVVVVGCCFLNLVRHLRVNFALSSFVVVVATVLVLLGLNTGDLGSRIIWTELIAVVLFSVRDKCW